MSCIVAAVVSTRSAMHRVPSVAVSRSYASVSHVLHAKKGGSGSPVSGPPSPGKSAEPKKLEPPPFVFKKVDKEVGPGAGKGKEYKNPEYFSYHEMSYADMDIVMSKLRCPQPSNGKEKTGM